MPDDGLHSPAEPQPSLEFTENSSEVSSSSTQSSSSSSSSSSSHSSTTSRKGPNRPGGSTDTADTASTTHPTTHDAARPDPAPTCRDVLDPNGVNGAHGVNKVSKVNGANGANGANGVKNSLKKSQKTKSHDAQQDLYPDRPVHPRHNSSIASRSPTASPSPTSPVSPSVSSPHPTSSSRPPSKKRKTTQTAQTAQTASTSLPNAADVDPPMDTQQSGGNNINSNDTTNNNSNNGNSRSSASSVRQTRIRKACDICRMRKVKCDGISPCKQCQSLGAECTFQYVSRHRGPTSRFAAGSAWSAQTVAAANNNTNGMANTATTDDSQDVHILNGHDDFNTHHSIHGHSHSHGQNHGFTDESGFDNASDFFASLLMTPQPMNLPQSPAIPDSLNTSSLPTSTLSLYRNGNNSGIPSSSSLRPRSPSSVASGNSIPSVGSAASPSVQSVPYSSSFFDAVATNSRRSPAAPPVHLSSTHTPHINIYPRMPRPQLNRQAVPPPPPPPPPANPQHQFPPLPPLPLQFHHAPQASQPQSKPPLNSDAIAPLHVLELLVDDFFTYIHPLIPFPHEPTFRRRFSNPDTRQEPGFLALLASMIGCLAASFPRSVRAHLKARASATTDTGMGGGAGSGAGAPFTRAVYMVACCRDVALAARGAAFYTKPVLSVDDAATSYFLGLAAGYTFDWHLCRRFMAEAMSFVQELGFHRRRPTENDTATHHQPSAMAAAMAALGSPHNAGATGLPRRFNHVEDQIGKRIFWILYLAMRSLIQLGATLSETPLPPFNNARPFPDLPAEVDDAYIEPDVIHPQPADSVSLITGFNKTIQIYATMDPIATMEYACGLHQVPAAAQRAMFVDALNAAKRITSTLPHELYLPLPGSGHEEGGDTDTNTVNGAEVLYDDLPGYRYYPPECDIDTAKMATTSYGTRRDSNRSASNDFSFGFEQARTTTTTTTTVPRPDDLRNLLTNHPARRRQVQYDIQKTNIYASQLATRSYYVEMYLHLGDEDTPEGGENPMHGERERIVHSLLFVLAAIPQCNMEPNGSALINKIRQVASTLLSVKPKSTGTVDDSSASASAAEAQLMRFLEILMRLERTGGPAGGVMAAMGVTSLDSLAGLNLPGMSVQSMQSMAGLASSMGLSASGSAGAGNDEEEELQSWASLREEQMRFAANGGFLGHYSM